MEDRIEYILSEYYNYNKPEITDLQILEEALHLGILCIRWRAGEEVVTIKSIVQDNKLLLIKLT